MTPLVVCSSSTIPFPAPAENRRHFVNYVAQDSPSTGSSFLARAPKVASSLLTDQRTLRFPSSIGFLRIQAPPIWSDYHFLILVREEPFSPSARFWERTGAVLGGLVAPSWSWISPETRIFSSGMRRGLQIPPFFRVECRLTVTLIVCIGDIGRMQIARRRFQRLTANSTIVQEKGASSA
jgi:hypothetical protein